MLESRAVFSILLLALAGCSSSSNEGSSIGQPPPAGSMPPANGEPAPGAAGSPASAPAPSGEGDGAEGVPGAVPLVPDAPAASPSGEAVDAVDAVVGDAGAGEATGEVPEVPATPGAPTASAGCGIANPPQGAGSLTIRGAQADYVVTLPNGYTGEVPTPLVYAFHGRNRTHVELQTIDAGNIQTELGSRYIMVYPKSQGGPGWNFDAEVPPSIEFFDALHARMLENYCVDTSRVFAVGHSSGGYFSIILACRYGSLLRGIGSVAGALQEPQCTDQRVAGIFIHGATDTVVANSGGRAARDQLLARNGCGQSTVAGSVAPCVAYEGCASGFPVAWCEHQEPTYLEAGMPTNHGWPSFASLAIRQFFEPL